jgi:GT2 family glycosyltransferase
VIGPAVTFTKSVGCGDQERSDRPRVGIVILHWGATEVTARCLNSLRRVSYTPKTVFLVDNARNLDASVAGLLDPGEVEVLRPERNLGFSEGSAMGAAAALAARAGYVLLLNNDVVVEPSFLDRLVEVAQADARAGLLCPQIAFLDRPRLAWYAGGEFSLWGRIPRHAHWKELLDTRRPPTAVEFATGCAMLIDPRVIQAVGFFEPRFFAYCEDLDFSLRARKAGFRPLLVPAAVIYHAVSDDEEKAAERVYYSTRNLLEVARTHARWYQWPTFLAGFVVSWVGFFMAIALFRRQPKIITAVVRGGLDFARRRFGERPA